MSNERRATDGEHGLGIGDGIASFFGGIGYVLTTPSTWPYAAVPVLMALLLACGLGGLVVAGALQIPDRWFGEEGNGWATTWRWLTVISAILVGLIAVLFAALALAQPFSGWALEAICLKQEESLTGRRSPEPSLLLSLWIGIRCTLFVLIVGTVLIGGLFVVDLLFPPAAVVTVPLKFLITGWLLAWDFLDYPLGLRGLGIRRRAAWVFRHWGAVTAFGLLWALVLLIPFVALLVLPMGVAGAARLVVTADE